MNQELKLEARVHGRRMKTHNLSPLETLKLGPALSVGLAARGAQDVDGVAGNDDMQHGGVEVY